jgi:hypothetical protein
MKRYGKELEFISWINRDGSGTSPVPESLIRLLKEDKIFILELNVLLRRG